MIIHNLKCCQYKTKPELTVVATERMTVFFIFDENWLFQIEKLKYSLTLSIVGSILD